jgi:hypothetical protein
VKEKRASAFSPILFWFGQPIMPDRSKQTVWRRMIQTTALDQQARPFRHFNSLPEVNPRILLQDRLRPKPILDIFVHRTVVDVCWIPVVQAARKNATFIVRAAAPTLGQCEMKFCN